MNQYEKTSKEVLKYLKQDEEMKKRAKYRVYILDWNPNDFPDSPTDVLRVFYVETIDELFIDVAITFGYYGYPICISDADVCNPDSFVMHDVLSACTAKNFREAYASYEEEKKQSLQDMINAQKQEALNQKKKASKVAVLILGS